MRHGTPDRSPGHIFEKMVYFCVCFMYADCYITWVSKGKGKGSCLESRLHDNACSTDFSFPLARRAPTQPATIDPTLDLCTRYPLQLGGLRQCGIRSLPDTSTHGQHWELNPDLHFLSPMSYPLGHMLLGLSTLH